MFSMAAFFLLSARFPGDTGMLQALSGFTSLQQPLQVWTHKLSSAKSDS